MGAFLHHHHTTSPKLPYQNLQVLNQLPISSSSSNSISTLYFNLHDCGSLILWSLKKGAQIGSTLNACKVFEIQPSFIKRRLPITFPVFCRRKAEETLKALLGIWERDHKLTDK